MKIQFKLILVGFAVIAVLVAAVEFATVNSNKKVLENIYAMDSGHQAYEEISKLEDIVLDQVHEGMHILAFNEEESIGNFRKLGNDFREQLKTTRATAAVAADSELQAKFAVVEISHQKFETMFDNAVKAYYAGELETKEQRQAMHDVWCPVADETIELTRKIQPLYKEMAEKQKAEVIATVAAEARKILIFMTLAAALFALAMSFFIRRIISVRLGELQHTAQRLLLATTPRAQKSLERTK